MKGIELSVDCAVLEGGGQIIRNALALGIITHRPTLLCNIRHGRPVPGLSKQHLEVVNLLKDLSGASVSGAYLRSTSLNFVPIGYLPPASTLDRNVGSAGAVSLVLQSCLPVILSQYTVDKSICGSSDKHVMPAVVNISFVGGTNVPFSPPLDHLSAVLFPILAAMGYNASVQIVKRGFYPVGGGRVQLSVRPCGDIQPLNLTHQSPVVSAQGLIYGVGTYFSEELKFLFASRLTVALESFLTARGLSSALHHIRDTPIFPLSCDIARAETASSHEHSGSGGHVAGTEKGSKGGRGEKGKSRITHSSFGVQLCLIREDGIPLSANVLYEGKKADFMNVDVAVAELIAQLAWVYDSGACVDEHTADQLIIYMALYAAMHGDKGVGVSQILCAPRIEKNVSDDIEHLQQSSYTSLITKAETISNLVVETAEISASPSTGVVVLHKSSLHIEAAIHIAQLFLPCTFTIEEVEESGSDSVNRHKCRLITCYPLTSTTTSS